MQRDQRVREAARAIYDKVYPGDEWTPVSFEEAERYRTVHYRNAVDAALSARTYLADEVSQQLALQFSESCRG